MAEMIDVPPSERLLHRISAVCKRSLGECRRIDRLYLRGHDGSADDADGEDAAALDELRARRVELAQRRVALAH